MTLNELIQELTEHADLATGDLPAQIAIPHGDLFVTMDINHVKLKAWRKSPDQTAISGTLIVADVSTQPPYTTG